jgi:hypothetical protein
VPFKQLLAFLESARRSFKVSQFSERPCGGGNHARKLKDDIPCTRRGDMVFEDRLCRGPLPSEEVKGFGAVVR